MLLGTLLVGITLRTQSNKAGVFGIMDKIKLLGSDEYKNQKKFDVKEFEEKLKSMSKRSSVEDVDKGPNRGYWMPILMSWLMAGLPSLTAILLSNNFLPYIETSAGFLAPIFLILLPCLITIKLHTDKKAPLSDLQYYGIWLYMIVGLGWSYFALAVNLYLQLTNNHA